MNINITHAVFAFFAFYFVYDNYKKIYVHDKDNNLSLNLKNIINNFSELLFSKNKENKLIEKKEKKEDNEIKYEKYVDLKDDNSNISISRKSWMKKIHNINNNINNNTNNENTNNLNENEDVNEDINEELEFNYDYILSNENIDFDLIPKNTYVYFNIGTKINYMEQLYSNYMMIYVQ